MSRRLVSRRDIAIDVYELDTGKVEVVANLLDPYHLIRLDLEVDPSTRLIERSEAQLANHPHTICPQVAERARALEGKTIGKGIMRHIRQSMGTNAGCVHLRELAMEAVNFTATCLIGYEDGYGLMSSDYNSLPETTRYGISRDTLAGTCHVYRGGDAPGQARSDSDEGSEI